MAQDLRLDDTIDSGVMAIEAQSSKSAATASSDDGFAEARALIDALASTPTQQLAIVVTQHPTLALHTTFALQQCAQTVLDTTGLPQSARQNVRSVTSEEAAATVDGLADVIRRLINRGDPSLARRLVPTQAALVDLAIATDASDILARLVDVQTGSKHLIEAASLVVKRLAEETSGLDADKARRAAIVLTSVVNTVPLRLADAASATPRRGGFGQASKQADAGEQDVHLLVAILEDVKKLYTTITATTHEQKGSNLPIALCAKIALLDAAWAVVERILRVIAPSGAKAHSDDHEPIWKALGLSETAAQGKGLLDLPMSLDLARARPLVNTFRQASRAPRVPILDSFEKTIQSLSKGGQEDGWAILRAEALASKQAAEAVPAEVEETDVELEAILAVLPHLAASADALRISLKQPPLAGKSTEEVVSMLLDRGDEILDSSTSAPSTNGHTDDLDILRSRANVFDDEPLEDARLVRAKGKQRDTPNTNGFGTGLSEELRARILQQAEEPDSDEEAREEWDPFYNCSRLDIDLEEAYEGPDGDFDAGTTTVRGRDARSDVSADDNEEGEADGSHRGAGHGSVQASGSRNQSRTQSPDPQAEATKASERILITTMKHEGEQAFANTARKTPARKALLDKLNSIRGLTTRWDDQLVESWATMFARNPRREKLLAAVDDIMRLGNPNANAKSREQQPSDDDVESGSCFGPNRGRGGRILRGATPGGPGSHSSRGGRGGGGGGGRGRGNNRGSSQRGQRGRGQSSRGRGAGAGPARP